MEYDFVPLPHRKKLRWPNGARLAVLLTINLEFWELTRNQTEPLYPGGPASIPYPVPGNVPDYVNRTWREYGQRVGIWRLMDIFDKAGVPATCTMNAKMGLERRRVVDVVENEGRSLIDWRRAGAGGGVGPGAGVNGAGFDAVVAGVVLKFVVTHGEFTLRGISDCLLALGRNNAGVDAAPAQLAR